MSPDRLTGSGPPSAVVLTPNLSGRDGISRLARLIARTMRGSSGSSGPGAPEWEAAVRVLALHDPASAMRCEDIPVRGAGGRSSKFAAMALRAAVDVDPRTTVVAVHLHLAPAALAFTTRGASLVTILCGIEAWKPLTRLQRAALDRSARLIAISSATIDRFRHANPHFANRPIAICHPGIEDAVQTAARIDRPPSVLIVGRMSVDERYKGHDLLIDAWPDIAAAVPGAALRIVGDGDDRQRLERKAQSLGLVDPIAFLGKLDDRALAHEYARCTAFAMPSRDEGFGFVFVEAMRAGRPCIAGRGAASEIVTAEETGLLVDAGDRAQLRHAVVRLLTDRAAANRMGAHGRARFLRCFTDDRFRDRFAKLVPVAPIPEMLSL